MHLFVDVSNNQGIVDWRSVARYGVEGAWVKATEGISYNDSLFTRNRAESQKHGIRFGAYHFARPDLHPDDPEAEAKHFCALVGKVGRRDLRPVLDFETHGAYRTDAGERLTAWARRFNKVVWKKLGVLPLFYSYPAFIQGLEAHQPIGAGLWLASYGRDDGKQHPYSVPAPWKKAVAHQFTSRGRIPGVPGSCDLSSVFKLRPVLAHPVKGRGW